MDQKKKQKTDSEIIYDGLQDEMRGPIGRRVRTIILETCSRLSLTKDLPPEIITYIYKETMKGRRAEGIAKNLSKTEGLTKHEIESACRTVVSVYSTALTQAQSEDLDLPFYIWRTCKDARVRDSHRLMQDVICSWDDPPSPEELNGEPSIGEYHPGDSEGCRCYAAPVLSLEHGLKWPCRVHFERTIVEMSKKRFIKESGWTGSSETRTAKGKRPWAWGWVLFLLLLAYFIWLIFRKR